MIQRGLTFLSECDRLCSSGPSKRVRRSRVLRGRSDEAEALAPSIDRFWFELPPLEAYDDLLEHAWLEEL